MLCSLLVSALVRTAAFLMRYQPTGIRSRLHPVLLRMRFRRVQFVVRPRACSRRHKHKHTAVLCMLCTPLLLMMLMRLHVRTSIRSWALPRALFVVHMGMCLLHVEDLSFPSAVTMISECHRLSNAARSEAGRQRHEGSASLAALIACLASPAPRFGTRPSSSPVAGSVTFRLSHESIHSPPMNAASRNNEG